MVLRSDFVQDAFVKSKEWKTVRGIADSLQIHMDRKRTLARLAAANQPGASSSEVQKVLLEHALELGFRDEAKGLFKDYANNGLRPDYFLPIEKTGIILEVERGKTNQNNMDFLDLWKCHICRHAHYLFLMVPAELRQNANGPVSRPYVATRSHMQSFFEPENYTNVRGLVLFGY